MELNPVYLLKSLLLYFYLYFYHFQKIVVCIYKFSIYSIDNSICAHVWSKTNERQTTSKDYSRYVCIEVARMLENVFLGFYIDLMQGIYLNIFFCNAMMTFWGLEVFFFTALVQICTNKGMQKNFIMRKSLFLKKPSFIWKIINSFQFTYFLGCINLCQNPERLFFSIFSILTT